MKTTGKNEPIWIKVEMFTYKEIFQNNLIRYMFGSLNK